MKLPIKNTIKIIPFYHRKAEREQRGKEVVMVVISDPNVEIYSVKMMFQTARKITFFCYKFIELQHIFWGAFYLLLNYVLLSTAIRF